MAGHITVALAFANLLLIGAFRVDDSSERASKMVCCLEDIGMNFQVRLISANQGAGTGKFSIKKQCKLVAMAAHNCESDIEGCESKCEQSFQSHPRYLEILKDEARANFTQVRDVKAPEERAEATKIMRHRIAVANKALMDAEQNASATELTLEQKKVAMELAKEKFLLAEEEMNATEEKLANQTATTNELLQDAEEEYKEATNEIDSRLDAAVAKIDSFENGKKERVAMPPQRCAESKYCCCSIRHIAVRVKTSQFSDWHECKNPQPYTVSRKLMAGKARKCDDVMTPCARCAYKVCADRGYGVCP